MKIVTSSFITLLIGILLAACQTPPEPAVNQTDELPLTPPTAKSTTGSAYTPTLTPSPTASVPTSDTPPPTETPTPLPSHTPTPRPSATPTPTPLPTLAPEAALALVQNLLESNAGCQLPCWWGAVPGETEWPTIRPFLQSFALQIYGGNTPDQRASYDVSFFLPGAIYDQLTIVYNVYQNVVQSIDVELGNLPNYSLSSILTTYGEPDEVWFGAQRPLTPDEDYLSMHLFLAYIRLGFAIYYPEEEFVQGELVYGCFRELTYPRYPILWMWSPEQNVKTLPEARVEGYVTRHWRKQGQR